MTQALITRQQVFDAADQLKREEKSVTGYATYKLLNNLGSLGTHYKYIAEWKTLQDASPTSTPDNSSLPEVVTTIMTDVNARLSKVIEAEVQSRVGAQAAIFRREAADASQQFAAALQDCERLLADLDEEKRLRELDRRDKDAALLTCSDLQLQASESINRARTAELREAEACRYVEDLKQKFDNLLQTHRAEQERCENLRREVADLQLTVQDARGQAAAAQRTVADANERLSVEATRAAEQAKALVAACEEARQEAKAQAQLAARLGGELGAVQRQADEYLGLIKKRRGRSDDSGAGGTKSHAN